MGNSPAFQFYPRQWLGDDVVMLMDWDARGMHIHLMCIAWQQDPPCTLPDDENRIRRWCGNPNDADWERVKPQILEAWKQADDRLVQTGLLREYEKQQTRKENAAKGGKKKAENARKLAETPENSTEPLPSGYQTSSKSLPNGCPSSSSSSSTTVKNTQAESHRWLMDFWNDEIAPTTGLPQLKTWTQTRNGTAKRRVKEYDEETVKTVLRAPLENSFLRGNGGRESWTGATYDWLMRPTNFVKVMEGNYPPDTRREPNPMMVGATPAEQPWHPEDVRRYGGETPHKRWDEFIDYCLGLEPGETAMRFDSFVAMLEGE